MRTFNRCGLKIMLGKVDALEGHTMPQHSYKCQNCHLVEAVLIRSMKKRIPKKRICPRCSEVMFWMFPMAKPHGFRPYWEDGMGPGKPIWIDSKETLRREAKSRGLTPAALM